MNNILVTLVSKNHFAHQSTHPHGISFIIHFSLTSQFSCLIFFKKEIHCISLAKMCQIHEGTSSIIRWLGLDRVVWANSWATLFACLLLNSIWEFWNLSTNICLQAEIIQPKSNVKSTLSNYWLETQSKAVCKPTVSPTSISHKGANHSVFARTKTPTSSLRHIPNPTLLREQKSMFDFFLMVNLVHKIINI